MIRGVHHAAVSTSDFDRSVAFYRDVIGGKVVYRETLEHPVLDELVDTPGASMHCAILALGGTFLEIQQYLNPAGRDLGDPAERRQFHHGLSHICLDVVDCDGEYERLCEAGVPFLAPPRKIEGIAKITYGRDPDGNLIELQEILVPDHPLSLAVPASGGERE